VRQDKPREDAVTTRNVGATAPPSTHSASRTRKLRPVLRVLLLVWAAGAAGVLGSTEALAQNAYITNNQSNYMSVINTVTNQMTATIPVGGGWGVAVSPDGRRVYVANGELAVIDTATNTVAETLGICAPNSIGVAVSPDGSRVYVTCTGGSVLVINAATYAVTATIPVSGVPYLVAVTPDGSKVYVTDYNDSTVTVINAMTNTVIAAMQVGPPFTFPAAGAVAVSPDGSKVYVTNQTSDTVSVINTATDTVTATIPVGDSISVAVSPDGSKLYIPNRGNHTAIVDAATNQVITSTDFIGGGQAGVSVTPDGRKVYVANYAADTVTVIDGMTYAILGTIPVGSEPLAFGIFIQPAPRFAGTPGKANCHGKSVSALARQYGGLNAAAAALAYPSVSALQNAIEAYCEA
jgi:YVTN family beta-propeller protein